MALIDLLKKIVQSEPTIDNINFDKYIEPIKSIDWCDNYFSPAAGMGRVRAKRVLFYINNFDIGKVSQDDLSEIKRIVGR